MKTNESGAVAAPSHGVIEPAMAMALNVHAGAGVYALLLGSGVSMASGVKTGWGVVKDLVGKVAAAREPEDPDASRVAMADPEGWWEANDGNPLGYSSLLAAAAPTSAARQGLLAGYFEPEDGDEDDAKAPTVAHRSIAQLVKRGSIRVILTTNFDRLMERALQEIGISPQVVHRANQVEAMKPLAHSPATVIKLHGDYADLEQRNTVDELDTYPDALQSLLERVLDEYGLIVCGWSADWDKALIRAIEGIRSRRYPMFWSQYGEMGEGARRLTVQHSAGIIDGLDADELFSGLMRRVEALDHMSAAPISRDVAVVQLKRALPDPVRRIELFDLVDQAASHVVDNSTLERRPVSAGRDQWADTFGTSLRGYRADADTLLHLLANGVFHDDGTNDHTWLRSVERLVHLRDTTPGSFNDGLEKLRHYPALLAVWAIGLGSVLSKREELIARIMTQPRWTSPYGQRKLLAPAIYLNPVRVMDAGGVHDMCHPEGGGRYHYPQSHWLRRELRAPFQLVEPNDTAFQQACSRFEFLASMIALDAGDERSARPWPGEFVLDSGWGYEEAGLAVAIEQELSPAWPLLQGGAFGGELERAQSAYEALATTRASMTTW